MENESKVYDYNSYLAGMNSKPSVTVTIHCTDVKNLEIEVSDLIEKDEKSYRVVKIGTVSHFMREEQCEKLFGALEPKLYDETFKEIEDKYLSEKAARKKLEEELEQFKSKLCQGVI